MEKILIIEDNFDNKKLFSENLKDEYKITFAGSKSKSLNSLLNKDDFDLILINFVIPEEKEHDNTSKSIDFELADLIKSRKIYTPFIFISSHKLEDHFQMEGDKIKKESLTKKHDFWETMTKIKRILDSYFNERLSKKICEYLSFKNIENIIKGNIISSRKERIERCVKYLVKNNQITISKYKEINNTYLHKKEGEEGEYFLKNAARKDFRKMLANNIIEKKNKKNRLSSYILTEDAKNNIFSTKN